MYALTFVRIRRWEQFDIEFSSLCIIRTFSLMTIDIRNISSRFFKEEIPSNRLGFLVLFYNGRWRTDFFFEWMLISSEDFIWSSRIEICTFMQWLTVRVSKVIKLKWDHSADLDKCIFLEDLFLKIQLFVEALFRSNSMWA